MLNELGRIVDGEGDFIAGMGQIASAQSIIGGEKRKNG